MTLGGAPIRFDWTVNITSLLNLAMLIGLVLTAVGSYYELKTNVKVALDTAHDAKMSISDLTQDRAEVRTQLGVISTKIDNLQANVEKLEQKIP